MVMGLTTDFLRRKQIEVGIELEKRKDPSPSNVGNATKLQARQLSLDTWTFSEDLRCRWLQETQKPHTGYSRSS